eukprot:1596090-Pyramimonas_sp.AAC.1
MRCVIWGISELWQMCEFLSALAMLFGPRTFASPLALSCASIAELVHAAKLALPYPPANSRGPTRS